MLAHCLVIQGSLTNDRRNILHYATITRTMIGSNQIVINSLRHTNNAQRVIFGLSKLGNLVRSILRIIPSAIEKVADIMGFKNLENTFVFAILFKFKPACT